ncbi:MAG TPA: hypothetical protein VGM57_02375 [Pseudolabrys sp.]
MTDLLPAGSAAHLGAATSAAVNSEEISTLTWASAPTWAFAGAAMVLALMAPALWNGFPLIFPDTGGYLLRPIEGDLAMGRSALYGLFLYLGIPLSFWPNALLQSALTAWLIVLTMRTHGFSGKPWLSLGIVVMLTVCTSLPWFAGQLMPDIFFFCAVLALNMLVFRSAQLATWERYALAAVIVVTIPSHMAAAGMCIGLVAALWLLTRFKSFAACLPSPRLRLAGIAVAASIAMAPVSNFAITGTFAFTPGGSSFLFGRLLEDGIVGRYLNKRCPDPALQICSYYRDLPREADDWLWGNDTAFYKLGGPDGFAGEQSAIIRATLMRYPGMHLTSAASAALEQFVTFKTEVSTHDNDPTIGAFKDNVPRLLPPLMSAEQQNDGIDAGMLNWLHVPVAALTIAGVGVALIFRRRLSVAPELTALCLTVVLALAANAAICGIFSHPVDRYQSRLVPLAPLAIALLVARHRREPPALSR